MSKKSFDATKSNTPNPVDYTALDNVLPLPVVQRSRRVKTITLFLNFSTFWLRLKKQLGVGVAPSNSSAIEDSVQDDQNIHLDTFTDEEGEVDLTVVDRVWFEELKSYASMSDNGNNSPPHEKSAMGPIEAQTASAQTKDVDSVVNKNSFRTWKLLSIIRSKLYPTLCEFFFTRFEEEKSENQYTKEDWILKKPLAIWAAFWLIVNWVLGVAFLDRIGDPVKGDIAFYFVVGPLLAFLVLWMVIYDWPRNRPVLYQLFLTVAIWAWGFYFVIYLKTCGFYSAPPGACSRRDFLGFFFYTTALQTMGLFGLKLNRLMATLGAFSFFVMTSVLMIPANGKWIRNMINFFVFHFVLIYVHYLQENSERRLHILRYQLKNQYRATQKAQINERKVADSKRRLTSYVFHEVRVPLNTALLAVQNMVASGNIMEDQQIELTALSGSLSIMSKVLNDVLDFDKMDSGKFEFASEPFAFHQVMRSLLIPLSLTTNARGLTLETYLDPTIDTVARKASYEALGEQDPEIIRKYIETHPAAFGVVIGDETRLRQIVTNLASNACKFTPSGGKLTIRTKLVLPLIQPGQDPLKQPQPCHERRPKENTEDKKAHSDDLSNLSKLQSQQIVVRIEVEDTGHGIRRDEMYKLFIAFNQTEQGRQQGGKGTGLGLALVRQIVKLSGGRLGVRSTVNQGSVFWVELPLGIGHQVIASQRSVPDLPMSQRINHIDCVRDQALSRIPVLEREFHASLMDQGQWDFLGLISELVLKDRNQENIISAMAMNDSPACTQHDFPQGSRQVENNQDGSTMPTMACTIMTTPNETSSTAKLMSEKNEDAVATVTTFKPLALDLEESSDVNVKRVSSATIRTPQLEPTSDLQYNEEGIEAPVTITVMEEIIQRPTFVQLPSMRFSANTTSPTPSVLRTSPISSNSTPSASPMALFDATHTLGSPSSLDSGINFKPTTRISVLVVDDDILTRTLMKRILMRFGCHVSVAENGKVAMAMILRQHTQASSDCWKANTKLMLQQDAGSSPISSPNKLFDEYKYAVVFLDNQMPVMSGLEVVAKLREMGRRDFVVGVTGNALLSDQREFLEAGADKVLTKPVFERSLCDVLQDAAERAKDISREAQDTVDMNSGGRTSSLQHD